MTPELRASYDLCWQAARQADSSFFYPFLLLPAAKRRSMAALYAFLRRLDDLSDGPQPAAEKGVALVHARQSLERALQGAFDDPQLPALADTVARYRIPPRLLHAVIDGVEMDLEPRCYETFDDLTVYCERVASAVGIACIHIWGFQGPQALAPARACGLAFQMTNILRDLREDRERGRIYLPLEDLRRCGYGGDDFLGKAGDENKDPRFAALLRLEIDRTRRLYREAAALAPLLHRDGRRVFTAMYAIYETLLDEIERRPQTIIAGRVRLGRWTKWRLVGGALWTSLVDGAAPVKLISRGSRKHERRKYKGN